MKLLKMKIVNKISIFFLLLLGFFSISNVYVNAWNGLNDLFNTDKNLLGKVIFVPINIKVIDYSFYGKYKNIKVVAYDGFTEKDVYNRATLIENNGMVNLLINVKPSVFDINRDITFKIYINNELYSVIKKSVIEGKAIASGNTKKVIDSYGKITTIDNLLLKNNLYSNINEIEKKVDKYKQGLLAKSEVQNYVILKNGKIDFDILPFSMNNLACNIKEQDLSYIEQKINTSIDRTKVVYDYPCKDGMMDLNILIKIIKAYNGEQSLIKNYNP